MKGKYYLSEMNISPKHGGGLTLMRILGEDLEGFDGFIRIDSYDERFESHPDTLSREINLWKEPGTFVKKDMPARFTKNYFINQVKRILKVPNTKYIEGDYIKRYYTDYLQKKIDLENSKFLIVPQRHYAVYYTNYLYRKYKIDYVTWVMDDHLLNYDQVNGGYCYPGDFEHEFGVHLKNAKHLFVISSNMGEFYKEKFGVDYSVLFSPTDPVKDFQFDPPDHNGTLKFCHFGRVWKWPVDAVEKLADKLESLNAELDIYSFYELEGPLKCNPRVHIKTPVSGDEVIHKMQEYDAVTIFYGFDAEVRHFSEMNISTKMSECLASGVPTLFVGPEYGAMTQFARKHCCGIVVSDAKDEAQWNAIKKLRDPVFRKEVLSKARQISLSMTSVDAMRKVWEEGWNDCPAA